MEETETTEPHPTSRPLAPDLALREIRQGSRPGSRYVRVVPKRARPFERQPGGYRATDAALRPRTQVEQAWLGFKRRLVGRPLPTSEIEEQRIPKLKALAVFSSDALSSSAYATDEILLVLVTAGTAALFHSIEIALAIGLLLAIVTFSYRQTIRAYQNGGGAYIVAKENLGARAGLTAAAALSVDYILTVSVSVAAGVFAIASAFPELHQYSVEISLGLVLFVTLANLRGIRESSTMFAIPTYVFIASFTVLLVAGFIRLALDPGLRASVPDSAVPAGTASLSLYLLMRAFASGSAALTGVEAISNGIPAFKKPESRNAAATLTSMVIILAFFFIGLTILAQQLHVQHAQEISVPAQVAQTVFGRGIMFYTIQASTALILILAANTSYADFPRLASILAKDKYVPHQFSFRGDRLGFSNGIIVLGVAACALLVAFDADVDRLIPLYAFGVFVSFTLSQSGMVVHWLRLRGAGWKQSMAINGVGAVATGIVAMIVGGTKFGDGAWISMALMLLLAIAFARIRSHYQRVGEMLAVSSMAPALDAAPRAATSVVVPVGEVNTMALQTLEYARSLSGQVIAVHVAIDAADAAQTREEWECLSITMPLMIIEPIGGSLPATLLDYLDAGDAEEVAVVLPMLVLPHWWQRWLHNRTAMRLRRALVRRPGTVVIEVLAHLPE